MGIAALCLALLLAGGRRHGSSRFLPLSMLVVAGMVGMAGQVVILLGYQGRFGTLFAEFGLLNALFLGGLAIGGLAPWGRWRALRTIATIAPPLAAAGIVALLELSIVGWPLRSLMMAAPLVLGASVGASLNVALRRLQETGDSASQLAVSLEFLDHTGAVVGAPLAATFLIPTCGLVDTAWLLAAIGVVPVLLVGAERLGWTVGGQRATPATVWRVLLVWGLILAIGSSFYSSTSSEPQLRSQQSKLIFGSGEAKRDPRSTWPRCQQIPGWGGPLEMLVEISATGDVEELHLGRQRETPEYLYGIDEWLRSVKGLPARELCYDCPDSASRVDAFTGATVTGEAVVAIVRCFASPEGDEAALAAGPGTPSRVNRLWRLEYGVALLSVLLGGALYWCGRWHLRTVLLVILALVGGVWLNQQLTIAGLLDVVAGPRPPAENIVLWVLLCGALFWGVLGGAIHCGYLCPAGAVMSLVSRVGLRWRLPRRWDRSLRSLKYVVATVVVWGYFVMPATDWAAADLLRYAFRGRYDFLGLTVVLLALLGALVWRRPWCRYLCPLGAVVSLGEGLALARRKAPQRRPANCHLGVEVERDWDCIRCNRCVTQQVPQARLHHAVISRGLAMLFVVTMLLLMVMRVLHPGGPLAPPPRVHRETQQAPQPALLPAQSEAQPPGPPLYRKDNDPYPIQRRPGTKQLEAWLRDGLISGEEARFFVPAPEKDPP